MSIFSDLLTQFASTSFWDTCLIYVSNPLTFLPSNEEITVSGVFALTNFVALVWRHS